MCRASSFADDLWLARGKPGLAYARLRKFVPFLMLVLLGCTWGLVMPLSSMAMAEKMDPFGLSASVSGIGALTYLALSITQKRFRLLTAREIAYFTTWASIDVVGQCLLFFVVRYVPSSTVSVIIILDGLMVFMLAALFRLEPASPKRLLGLATGFVGLVVIIGFVDPVSASVGVVTFLALGVPLSYAAENLLISSRWPDRVDAIFGIAAMQTIATAISGSLVLVSGSRLPIPDTADGSSLLVLLICFCVATANWLFQALVKRSGSVFASQSSYLVTIAGIGWSVLLLGEVLPSGFWIGAAAVLLGIFIVQPGGPLIKGIVQPTGNEALT